MEQRAHRLRRVGLRATGSRLAILRALEGDRTHPTPEQLHRKLRRDHPSLSLSTVYDTLESFVRTGLCRRVSDAGARLRVDGTPDDHDHAVCGGCSELFDVDRSPGRSPPTAGRLPGNLRVTGLRVMYDVLCAGCDEAVLKENGWRPGGQVEDAGHHSA